MRKWMWSGFACALAMLGLGAIGVPGAANAASITVPIVVDLETGSSGVFGTVEVEEVGQGDLAFTISLDTDALGETARQRNFYFNFAVSIDDDEDDDDGRHPGKGKAWGRWWDDVPPGKSKRDDDSHEKSKRDDDDDDDDVGFLRISGIRCNGGACDEDFHLESDVTPRGADGAHFDFGVDFGHGNEMLQVASFILSAKSDLSLTDVLGVSTTDGGIDSIFAVRVKGLGETGDEKATLGAIPEPQTSVLLGLGLLGLAVSGRRRDRRG